MWASDPLDLMIINVIYKYLYIYIIDLKFIIIKSMLDAVILTAQRNERITFMDLYSFLKQKGNPCVFCFKPSLLSEHGEAISFITIPLTISLSYNC